MLNRERFIWAAFMVAIVATSWLRPVQAGMSEAAVARAIAQAVVTVNQMSNKEAQNLTRGCIPSDGHSTQLADISASSASGQLSQNTGHWLTCTGATALRIEMGDSAAATADGNSQLWPVDVPFFFVTGSGSQSRYVSVVDSATTAGNCSITVCE